MVQLGNSSHNVNDTSVLSIILLSASMLSLVISFLGIKLKWFRHRLTLEQPASFVESPVLLRTTSVTEIRENCARGVYRQSADIDSLVFQEEPSTSSTTAKAVKVKPHDRSSIFRFPFRNKLNFAKSSSRKDQKISTIQQANASVHPPNRDQDVATLHKNETLSRKIHHDLQLRNSTSMPDLLNRQSLSPNGYRERSVDGKDSEQPIESKPANIQPVKKEEITIEPVRATKQPEEAIQIEEVEVAVQTYDGPTEAVQKRVKFEEVHKIQESFYEVQADIDFGEDSRGSQSSIYEDALSSPSEYYEVQIELPPPTPMKRKSKENIFTDEDDDENAIFAKVKPRARQEAVMHLELEDEEPETKPFLIEIPVKNPEPTYAVVKKNHHVAVTSERVPEVLSDHSQITEVDEASTEEMLEPVLTPPPIKPRTKRSRAPEAPKIEISVPTGEAPIFEVTRLDQIPEIEITETPTENEMAWQELGEVTILHNSQIVEIVEEKIKENFIESLQEEPDRRIEVLTSSTESIQAEQPIAASVPAVTASISERPQIAIPKVPMFIADDIPETQSTEDIQKVPIFHADDIPVTQPVEVVPKSILKTSEISGGHKSIKFQSLPDTIPAKTTIRYESDGDSDEDIWNRVDEHRWHMSRSAAETPPPIPKTPPPTAEEEEKLFSYA